MNKNQITFQFGRVLHHEAVFLFPVGLTGYNVANALSNISASPTPQQLTSLAITGIISAGIIWMGNKFALKPALVYHRKVKIIEKDIKNKTRKYPLETANTIILDDKQGLESLLNHTAEKRHLEWGTFLNATPDKDRAVIYQIHEFQTLKEEGIVNYGTPCSFRPKITIRESRERFDGLHHYHPSILGLFRGVNYVISKADKCIDLNWVNLLTFNMQKGPEVIAYNTLNTYIPADSSKKVLKKATNKEIMKYLSS